MNKNTLILIAAALALLWFTRRKAAAPEPSLVVQGQNLYYDP